MSVPIDTSVWVDHFRNHNDVLASLLLAELVLTHKMVIVDLACRTPPAPRTRTLEQIGLLRTCNQASLEEVMNLIEREKLYGLGCGMVDTALLGSTLITPGARLWTFDKRLANLAERFGVAFHIGSH
jgi:predicted nucleic acid-binding protein